MSLDYHIEKGDDHYLKLYGVTKEVFLRKMRARTVLMTKILKRQSDAQRVTPEMLNRVIDL